MTDQSRPLAEVIARAIDDTNGEAWSVWLPQAKSVLAAIEAGGFRIVPDRDIG